MSSVIQSGLVPMAKPTILSSIREASYLLFKLSRVSYVFVKF